MKVHPNMKSDNFANNTTLKKICLFPFQKKANPKTDTRHENYAEIVRENKDFEQYYKVPTYFCVLVSFFIFYRLFNDLQTPFLIFQTRLN
jgi:hypothetical protein